MNLGQLRQAILDRGLLLSTDSGATAGIVNGYVNEAIHWIETEEPNGWPWLWYPFSISTAANQERYTFATIQAGLVNPPTLTPGGIVKIVAVERTIPGSTSGPVPMKRYSRLQADQMYPFTIAQPPEIWYVTGTSIGLKPICDSVYTITGECVIVEPTLAADGDTPLMPSVFHSAIIEKASEIIARHLMNYNKATEIGTSYKAWVQQMRRYSREYVGPGRVQATTELERY